MCMAEMFLDSLVLQEDKNIIYRSPSKYSIDFENFLLKIEKVLSETALSDVLSSISLHNFNVRSSVQWTKDKITVDFFF